MSQNMNLSCPEGALLLLEEEVCTQQDLKHSTQRSDELCPRFTVGEDVVEEDEASPHMRLLEQTHHSTLQVVRRVGVPHAHHAILVHITFPPKSNFPPVLLTDRELPEPPLEVHFGNVLRLSEFQENLRDQG